MKRYTADAALIVFSVLFALLITRLYEAYKTTQDKQVALDKIRIELYRNQGIINRWADQHTEIRDRAHQILEGKNDSLRNELMKYQFLNLMIITNGESLIDALLTSTAWETAKSTGIVSEFGFELTQQLTLVYQMQDVISNRTITKILDGYFDKSAHDMDELDLTLLQLQLLMSELVGQETLLKGFYQDAIDLVNKTAPVEDYVSKHANSEN